MFYVSLLMFVFFVAVTMADVKKEYGEFRTQHTDQLKKTILIKRYYSSRSLFKGYFGYNWCSDLDYKITISSKNLSLFDCEIGKHLIFEKTSGTDFINLENDLSIQNDDLFFKYVTPSTSYFFSKNGVMSHWIPKGMPAMYAIYKNTKLSRILSKQVGSQSVVFDNDGLIQKIGGKLSYSYDNGILKKVTQGKIITWKYRYDEFMNMTLWRGPSNYEIMKYDSEWDRIIYFKDANNCRFHFQYEIKQAKKFIIESQKCLKSGSSSSLTLFEIVSPNLLVKSPSDLLSKEFRGAPIKTGGTDAQIF